MAKGSNGSCKIKTSVGYYLTVDKERNKSLNISDKFRVGYSIQNFMTVNAQVYLLAQKFVLIEALFIMEKVKLKQEKT